MDKFYKHPNISRHRRSKQLQKIVPKGSIIYTITQPNGDYLKTTVIKIGGVKVEKYIKTYVDKGALECVLYLGYSRTITLGPNKEIIAEPVEDIPREEPIYELKCVSDGILLHEIGGKLEDTTIHIPIRITNEPKGHYPIEIEMDNPMFQKFIDTIRGYHQFIISRNGVLSFNDWVKQFLDAVNDIVPADDGVSGQEGDPDGE